MKRRLSDVIAGVVTKTPTLKAKANDTTLKAKVKTEDSTFMFSDNFVNDAMGDAQPRMALGSSSELILYIILYYINIV